MKSQSKVATRAMSACAATVMTTTPATATARDRLVTIGASQASSAVGAADRSSTADT